MIKNQFLYANSTDGHRYLKKIK